MSRSTMTASKADSCLQRYLDMGPNRSIRRLATELQRSDSAGGAPPQERTLFRWSAQFGWDRRAQQFDQEVAERAKGQLLEARANAAQTRMTIALDTSIALHHMVRSAITIEDEVSTNNPDGPVLRSRNFDEISNADKYAMLALLQTARAIDKDILGDAQVAYERYQEQQGSQGPTINVLGPEALTEMSFLVGNMVKRLDDAAARKREERSLAVVEPEATSEPEVEWEEVPDGE